ncbi:MAG: site-specific integrase [Prevotella sp.]|nr:site-specific integrase [Prevotella sp.]
MIKIFFDKTAKANSENRYRLLLKIQPYCNGKVTTMRAKSNIYIDEPYFDKTQGIKNSKKRNETKENAAYHREQSTKLQMLVNYIQDRFDETDRSVMDCKWLFNIVDNFYHPNKQDAAKVKTFFDLAEDYLNQTTISDGSKLQFKSVFRNIYKYQRYMQETSNKNFEIDINKFTVKDLEDIRIFLRKEKELRDKNPKLFEEIRTQYPTFLGNGKETVRKRGENMVVNKMNYLKVFWSWLNKQEITENNPFKKFEIGSVHYGTPYYITIEQRDLIANTPMKNTILEKYRDAFTFQCLVGCRVSDLARFTFDNIVKKEDGYYLIYTPIKTRNKGMQSVTAVVPLDDDTLNIIAKYKGQDSNGYLFPTINKVIYDDKIKQIFTIAGVTDKVKVRNSVSGEEEWKPLNEVASSHMARRTFIGNIYNNGCPDPNLIGAMSGHVNGSKAFARYRKVDDTTLRNVIGCLRK